MKLYLRSEIYRIFHRMNSYVFIGICTALLISSNIVLAALKHVDKKFPYATTFYSIANLYTSFLAIFLLCVLIGIMIFGNEYGYHTMKNSLSYGISRKSIYFGKLIIEIIYGVAAFTLISSIHIAAAFLLLEDSGSANLILFLKTVLYCLPLLLFSISATNCFIFLFESTGAAITAILSLLVVLPLIANLLGMKFEVIRRFADILPFNMIKNTQFDFDKLDFVFKGSVNTLSGYWISGIIQTAIVIIIGYCVFQKREIK